MISIVWCLLLACMFLYLLQDINCEGKRKDIRTPPPEKKKPSVILLE